MSRTYPEFEEARETRMETLEMADGLDQSQSEWRPKADKWSPGEVLDHLAKLDAIIVRELDLAIQQRRRGLPFVYRGIADIDTTIPWVLRPVLPFVEIPFTFFNSVLPGPVRRAFTGNRSVPLQAPGVLKPRFGRPIETLRHELRATFEKLERQQTENPDVNLSRLYYYNPIAGLSNIPGMYKFVSNHEKRHHGQLRDLIDDLSMPQAA